MKVYLNIFVLIFIFYAGCSNPSHIEVLTIKQDKIKEISNISFDDKSFIDSCLFIPLETSVQSLIGYINQIEIIDNKFFILDERSVRLKVFDHNGKFLYDVGRKGRGPGEYIAPMSFFVNNKEKKIGIIDIAHVHEYNLEGVYLKSISINLGITGVEKATCVGDEIFCYTQIDHEHNMNYMLLSSEDYSLKKRFRPYLVKPKLNMRSSLMVHPYCFFNGKIHYTSLFSDTIFIYENGKEIPYLFIETGKPNVSSRYIESLNLDDPWQVFSRVITNERYSPGLSEFCETDNFILTGLLDLRNFYLWDKKAEKGFRVKYNKLPDLGMPKTVDGNKIVRVWQPEQIQDYQDAIKEGTITCPEPVKTILKGYDPEYHNPILVIYYLSHNSEGV